MEEFNLSNHTIEETSGKSISINGVQYIFLSKLTEGENYWIFPLRHVQCGYSRFVAKILKMDPESEQYKKIRLDPVDNSFWINLEADSPLAVHTEIYEVNGTLLKFQEALYGLREDEIAAYRPDLMNSAKQQYRKGNFKRAIDLHEQILALNPYHTDALINAAACHATLGNSDEAIKAMLRAVEIDGNYRPSYFQLSRIYQEIEYVENAVAALKITLDRYPYDSEVLTSIIDLCLEYDMMAEAAKHLATIHDFLGLSVEEYLLKKPELKEKIIATQYRIKDYNALLADACQQQSKRLYGEAEEILAKAMSVSKNNVVAEFNFYLCRYHQGVTAITAPLIGICTKITEPIRRGYCFLLCLLIAIDKETSPYPLSQNMVNMLANMLRDGTMNIYDLSSIPIHYYQDFAVEDPDYEVILEKLRTLRSKLGHQEDLDLLYEGYQQLANDWSQSMKANNNSI